MAKPAVDIARIADDVGLSRTTVSYVLNGKYQQVKIPEKTAARVLEAAQRLGYRSNFWAKSLVSKRSRLIGVMFPDITGSAAHQIMEGVQDVFDEAGYEAIMAVSFWKREREQREIELMLEKRIEGILALPQAASEATFDVAVKAGCPVVFMCDWLPRVKASSVTMDTQDAVWKCLEHLAQQGRNNIKFLAVDYASKTLVEREEAFKAGLAQLGLNVSADSVVYTELAKLDSVYRVIRDITQGADRPDALVCVSDAVALSALSECARLGVRIPGDLAVTGLGNLQFTDHPFFSLTTVDECRKEIGKQAAQLVLQQISQDQVRPVKPEHIRIKSPLIIRNSTGGLLVEA